MRLFVKTLTADEKYSRHNIQNFPQEFQTLLFKKQKIFSAFFIAFLKCDWNLEDLQKKYEYPRLINSEIIKSEIRGFLHI